MFFSKKYSSRNEEIRKKLKVTVDKWFHKHGCNKLHTKQPTKLCRPMSKEAIEFKVRYNSAADGLAGKGRLNERHAKTRIKSVTITIAIKRWVTLGLSTGGKREND